MNPRIRAEVEPPTRVRLLTLLRLGPRTVDELATLTGLTSNAIRSQLASLSRDGLVRSDGVRHRDAAGKPPIAYTITEDAEAQFSVAYLPALTAVAETLVDRMPPADRLATYRAAGERLARGIGRRPGAPAAELATSLLESLGGAATVHRDGERVIVQGAACPLAATVRACPESCELVRALLAGVTETAVATRCDHGDAPACRFEIG